MDCAGEDRSAPAITAGFIIMSLHTRDRIIIIIVSQPPNTTKQQQFIQIFSDSRGEANDHTWDVRIATLLWC